MRVSAAEFLTKISIGTYYTYADSTLTKIDPQFIHAPGEEVKFDKFERTVAVKPSGGDYTTLQAAKVRRLRVDYGERQVQGSPQNSWVRNT